MTNSLRFGINNHADSSIISGLTSIASLPLANMKDRDIQKIWRSAEIIAQQSLVIDLSQSRNIGYVALINLNNSSSTFNVRVSATDPTGLDGSQYSSLNIPTTVDSVYNTFIHFIEPAVTGRYVRITMNSLTGSPECGRLAIGETWLPSRHISLVRPPEEIPLDHTRVSYSLGGNRYEDIRARQRRFRFALVGIPTAEKDAQIVEINRIRGIGLEILVCFDKDSSNIARDTVWGNMMGLVQPRRMAGVPDAWECEFEIEERI